MHLRRSQSREVKIEEGKERVEKSMLYCLLEFFHYENKFVKPLDISMV